MVFKSYIFTPLNVFGVTWFLKSAQFEFEFAMIIPYLSL